MKETPNTFMTVKQKVPNMSDKDDKDEEKKDAVTILIELGSTAKLFHDAVGDTYADIEINGIEKTVLVNSRMFADDLSYKYFDMTKRSASKYHLKDAINTIHAKAKYEGEEKTIYNRVANFGDKVIIDTCREIDRFVVVSSDGIDNITDPDEKFFHQKTMNELPELSEYDDIHLLKKYINVSDNNLALIYGWLFCVLAGVKPFPILVLQGEQGTGKSTLTKLLRLLIDPSTVLLRSAPRSVQDLLVSALNTYLVVLDNLSGIKAPVSDCLCSLSTGGGIDQRKLYTNGEQYLIDIQRPVIVNGISDIATRPDLAERSIILELPVIEPDKRRSEKEFWEEFEKDKSPIYTGILDCIVSGFRHQDDIVLDEKPRMADVVQWATACERDRGMEGNFITAYKANQARSKRDGIESSPVGEVLMKLMATRGEYIGTTTELLNKLADAAGMRQSNSRSWPQSPKQLNSDIKRLTPSFRTLGITISKGANNKREYVIVNTKFKQENSVSVFGNGGSTPSDGGDSDSDSRSDDLPLWGKK